MSTEVVFVFTNEAAAQRFLETAHTQGWTGELRSVPDIDSEDLLDLSAAWAASVRRERALRQRIEALTGKSPEDFLARMRELLG